MSEPSLLLVRCNHCGGAMKMGDGCGCQDRGRSASVLEHYWDAMERGDTTVRHGDLSRALQELHAQPGKHVVVVCPQNDPLLTEAACLADDLERAGNIWGAQVVRRLAGLPITQEASP
jgi:hypothetical protein